jgi:hypothetical protein
MGRSADRPRCMVRSFVTSINNGGRSGWRSTPISQRERWKVTLPVLEDADSIQMGLVDVMRLIVTQQIDHPFNAVAISPDLVMRTCEKRSIVP